MGWPRLWVVVMVMASLCGWPLPALADEPKASGLHWLEGPTEAKLGDQALLKLPTGYRFLGAQETQQLLKQMGNFPAGSELGLITATGEGEQWFMVVRYIDAGYVKDDEAANWSRTSKGLRLLDEQERPTPGLDSQTASNEF